VRYREWDSPLASVRFASCYVYSPRGSGWLAEDSRVLCARVKTNHPLWLSHFAGHVYRSSLQDRELAGLFAHGAALVPVPGSARTGESPWGALRLAVALSGVGFGIPVWIGLRRRYAVIKSATAAAAARPSVQQHYNSFAATLPPMPMSKIVLIDDVVTKGRTLLAAAARLRSISPHVDIQAFALIRTQGFAHRLERMTEPCYGVIRWAGADARREP
jgi:predicted amidophosphoribosyltransferase